MPSQISQILQISIPPLLNTVFFSTLITALAFVYSLFYMRTRHYDENQHTRLRSEWKKYAICFTFDLLTCFLASKNNMTAVKLIFPALTMLIANLDILLLKIPTELLILLIASSIKIQTQQFSIPVIAASALSAFLFCIFRKKIGIALYDIILSATLAMLLPSFTAVVYFIVCFLIFWGLTGLILKKTSKNVIPLAPVITAAYWTVQLFQ